MPQLLKFFADNGGPESEHGKPLHWPGTPEGFPYRGDNPPLAKRHEMDDMAHVLDFKSEMFELWDPPSKARFDAIMDRIKNGWYVQCRRDDRWLEDKRHYSVWLEWVQIYGEDATSSKSPRSAKRAEVFTINQQPPRPGEEPGDGFSLTFKVG